MFKVYNIKEEKVKVIYVGERFVCVLKDQNRNFEFCEILEKTQNFIIKNNINELLNYDYIKLIFKNLKDEKDFSEFFIYDSVYANLSCDVIGEIMKLQENEDEKCLKLLELNNFIVKDIKSHITFL